MILSPPKSVTKPLPGAQINWGHPLTRGLAAWWLCNGVTNGRLTDIYSTNHGVLTNGATLATGRDHGGAVLRCDGTDDYVDMGNVLNMRTDSFTITAWFKTTVDNVTQGVVAKSRSAALQGRYWIIFFGAANIEVGFEGVTAVVADLPSDASYMNGKWHFLAAVWNRAGNMSLYLDGVFKVASDISASSAVDMNTSDPLYISEYGNATGTGPSGSVWHGELDDVRVWRRVVSPLELDQVRLTPYAMMYSQSPSAKYFLPDTVTPITGLRPAICL